MPDVPSFAFNFPYFKEIVTAIVGVPTFAYGCYRYGRRQGSSADLKIIGALREDLAAVTADLDRLQSQQATLEKTVRDPRDFWIRDPDPQRVTEHHNGLRTSMPIICVVNFKGGVGKTTICANLGAHFAAAGKRVLLIDCDYQGSLSDTALSQARKIQCELSSAPRAIARRKMAARSCRAAITHQQQSLDLSGFLRVQPGRDQDDVPMARGAGP